MRIIDTAWEDANGIVWNIQFVEEDDELVSVNVASATGEPLPLTTLTRTIPYGKLLQRERQRRYGERHVIPPGSEWSDRTKRTWEAPEAGPVLAVVDIPPPRRRTINRELMEEVADVYKAARGLGNPTEKVEDHFYVSYSTAARWVSMARRDPWNTLPPTTRGKST